MARGGRRSGAGRPAGSSWIAKLPPAMQLDFIEALYRQAKRGNVGAMRAYLARKPEAGAK
jgi:hypothetical protein